MARIELDAVTKQFPDGTTAVRSLYLAVGDGELLVLVGPSAAPSAPTSRSPSAAARTYPPPARGAAAPTATLAVAMTLSPAVKLS